MAEVVVIGAADAEVGVRKLRAAGYDVMWVKTEKGGQLKDPEIRDAHLIVFDYKHVESDILRRTKLIGTPYFLVGATDGVTWSTCLRPIVAMLRAVVSDRGDGGNNKEKMIIQSKNNAAYHTNDNAPYR